MHALIADWAAILGSWNAPLIRGRQLRRFTRRACIGFAHVVMGERTRRLGGVRKYTLKLASE